MELITEVASLRCALHPYRSGSETIGFVPTMGNLHAGHLALVARAKAQADVVVVSIFVNPTQFDREDDLARYPRTLETDLEQLRSVGVQYVFAPSVEVMYPLGAEPATSVEVPGISQRLEGLGRLGHFSGVATIVNKLFNLVQPDIAVFGEKDFQQLQVIRKMASDLNLPVQIISQPTVREADGLALSSRNGLLAQAQRALAPQIHRVLADVANEIRAGYQDYRELEAEAQEALLAQGFKPEYVEICDPSSLRPAEPDTLSCVILAAAWLEKIRLIDNVVVEIGSGIADI